MPLGGVTYSGVAKGRPGWVLPVQFVSIGPLKIKSIAHGFFYTYMWWSVYSHMCYIVSPHWYWNKWTWKYDGRILHASDSKCVWLKCKAFRWVSACGKHEAATTFCRYSTRHSLRIQLKSIFFTFYCSFSYWHSWQWHGAVWKWIHKSFSLASFVQACLAASFHKISTTWNHCFHKSTCA